MTRFNVNFNARVAREPFVSSDRQSGQGGDSILVVSESLGGVVEVRADILHAYNQRIEQQVLRLSRGTAKKLRARLGEYLEATAPSQQGTWECSDGVWLADGSSATETSETEEGK